MWSPIAPIHKDTASDDVVSFPDLPGCVNAGTTLDEARLFAGEALALHPAGLAEDGDVAPEPSSLEAVMAARDDRDAVAVLVSPEASPRAVHVDVAVPEDVLAEPDAHAARHEPRGLPRPRRQARDGWRLKPAAAWLRGRAGAR